MFSFSSMILQLSGVAFAFASITVETIRSSPEPSVASLIADGFNIWFDDVVRDAFSEGILALAVFCVASFVLRSYRRNVAKSRAKVKMASFSKSSTKPSCHRGTIKTTRSKPEVEATCPSTSLPCQKTLTKSPKETVPTADSQRSFPGALGSQTKRVKQTDADSLVAAIRSGNASQLNSLLDTAHSRATIVAGSDSKALENISCDLLLASLRACASSRCFDYAIQAYDHMASRIGSGSSELWSVLLYNIAELGAFDRCNAIFEKLCLLSDPSGHDIVNMLRCYIGSQDLIRLREVLKSLRSKDLSISAFTLNRALAACGASAVGLDLAEELVSSQICPDGLDSVGYNSLMKCNARAGRLDRCFHLRKEMLAKGLELSEITYGILLDACVGAKELGHARKVFEDLCASGLQLNVVHCTTFIKALVGVGNVDEASCVLQEMARSTGVQPDLIAYSTIVKAHAEKGNAASALRILEEMIATGVRPDEIIFNSVLSACSVFPLKSAEVLRIFESLVGHGMRPTTTTFSIALKGLVLTDAFAMSLQLLEEAPVKFGMVLEPRLYMQLARACIKARNGRGLLDTFDAMVRSAKDRGQSVESSDVSVLVRNCALGGEVRIAGDLLLAAERAGIALEPSTVKLLKSAVAKKAKQGR